MASDRELLSPSNFGMYDTYTAGRPDPQTKAEQDPRTLDEDARMIDVQREIVRLLEVQKADRAMMDQAMRAYFSDSWDIAAKAERDRLHLPTNNINIFADKVDTLVGNEINARRKIKLLPVGRDDEQRAELLNVFLDHQERICSDYYYDISWFRTGLINGRSHKELVWSFERSPLGELKTILRPSEDILIDHNATDIDTLEGDTRIKIHMEWLTPRELKAKYPKAKLQWERVEYREPPKRDNNGRMPGMSIAGVTDSYDWPSDNEPSQFWDRDNDWIRVFRIWRKDYKKVWRLIDTDPEILDVEFSILGEFETKGKANSEKVRLAYEEGRKLPYMVVQDVMVPYWSYQVISGRLELEWQEDIGKYHPWVDFFAIYHFGKFAGLYNRIRDDQEWVNFAFSKLTERMGRMGHMPTVWRDNSFTHNINLAAAIRDGKPIIVKEEVWDRLGGQTPFHTIQDNSLTSIGPILNFIQELKQYSADSTGASKVQRGEAPGSVTAASGIAILAQQSQKMISTYSQNINFARAQQVKLRLQLLLQRYEESPTLSRLYLERILTSAIQNSQDRSAQQLLMRKFLDGGVDIDTLIKSIRDIQYDVELTVDPDNILERQAVLQELQVLANLGLQTNPKDWVDFMPALPVRLKDQIRASAEAEEQRMKELLSSPQGQMQLQMEAQRRGGGKGQQVRGMINQPGQDAFVSANQ